jgi:hypothetical protein
MPEILKTDYIMKEKGADMGKKDKKGKKKEEKKEKKQKKKKK